MVEIVAKGVTAGTQGAELSGISDLDLYQIGGIWHLYATTRSTAGIDTLELAASGQLSVEHRLTVETYGGFAPTDHAFFETASGVVVHGMGRNLSQFDSYASDADGALNAVSGASFVGGPATSTLALTDVVISGQTFVVSSHFGSAALQVFRYDESGVFFQVSAVTYQDAANTKLASTWTNDQTFVFASHSNGIDTFLLGPDGTLNKLWTGAQFSALGISGPSHLETVTLGEVTFLLVAGQGSSSLSVFEVLENGTLSATDHVFDDLSTRFFRISELDVTQGGDRAFIVVAGSDDGFSLLELLPDGRLIGHGTKADATDTTLNNVSGIAAHVAKDTLHVYAASENEPGVTWFEIDTGPTGAPITGSAGSEVISGTNAGEILSGGMGDDTILGGAGNDVLVDGAGTDRLTGGPGQDVFVLRQDGETDVIADFEPGIDRIDLSTFAQLRSSDQLLIRSTQTGAEVTFGNDTLLVQSQDGGALNRAEVLYRPVLALSHGDIPVPAGLSAPAIPVTEAFSNPTFYDFALFGAGGGTGAHIAKRFIETAIYDSVEIGTQSNDTLYGGVGQDTLNGRAGDDHLTGGAGADTFVFGAGHDKIADFVTGVDKLQLEEELYASVFVSAQSILQHYGTIDGGTAVLDFGVGYVLTVDGIASLDVLAQDVLL